MQPYAFPYLGYFQLMAAVDVFVLLDDVAWIKGGWINRNRLAGRNGVETFVFPVTGRAAGIPISQVELFRPERHRRRFLRQLKTLYGGAPHFRGTQPLVESCLGRHDGRIADSIGNMTRRLAEHLGIGCCLLRSGMDFAGVPGRGAERVVGICKALGAEFYFNAEGGRELYDDGMFRREGIELRFLLHRPRVYANLLAEFVPRLSILDVLMFNSVETVRDMLTDCSVVAPEEAST